MQYADPYRGITGLYGYEVKKFIYLFNLIYFFNLLNKGGKKQLCERLYMFPVCAQTICYCLVWPANFGIFLLCSYLALSLCSRCPSLSPPLWLHHSVHSVTARWHYCHHCLCPVLCC